MIRKTFKVYEIEDAFLDTLTDPEVDEVAAVETLKEYRKERSESGDGFGVAFEFVAKYGDRIFELIDDQSVKDMLELDDGAYYMKPDDN